MIVLFWEGVPDAKTCTNLNAGTRALVVPGDKVEQGQPYDDQGSKSAHEGPVGERSYHRWRVVLSFFGRMRVWSKCSMSKYDFQAAGRVEL